MMFICSAMAMESRRNLNREEVEDCILQMAQGDKDALARIYEMTHAAVYGFSLSILRNAQDAEDVLQETYLQLYHHAPAYRPNGNPMPYLFTIAKNFSLMKLRDRKKTQQMPEDDLLFREVCGLVTPALAARGMSVAASRGEAAQEVLLRYGMGEPTTILRRWTYPDYQTVYYHGRAFTVRVERTEWTEHTRYHAQLILSARRLVDGQPGRQIWRTEMTVSGAVDDFRKLISMGIPALRQVLASQTSGRLHFEVSEDRDGEVTVSGGE